VYDLPENFSYLAEEAGANSEPLNEIHQVINRKQCSFSRGGYMVDIDPDGEKGPMFYISTYDPERLLKYQYQPNKRKNVLWYVVIDITPEADLNGDDKVYRVLGIQEGKYFTYTTKEELPDDYNPETAIIPAVDAYGNSVEPFPMYAGNYIDEIPFLYICDNVITPDYHIPFYFNVANRTFQR